MHFHERQIETIRLYLPTPVEGEKWKIAIFMYSFTSRTLLATHFPDRDIN